MQRSCMASSHGCDDAESPRPRKGEESCKEYGEKAMCHTMNTTVGGFAGGETIFSRRRYARQILTKEDLPTGSKIGETKALEVKISFSEKDAICIHPHNDDPIIITIRCDECEIIRVMLHKGSSTDILYFERLRLNLDDLKGFKGSLVRFSEEYVQVKSYITLKTTFGMAEHAKQIKVRYLVIDDQGQVSGYWRSLFL